MKIKHLIFSVMIFFLLTGCNSPHIGGVSETEEVASASSSSAEEIPSASDSSPDNSKSTERKDFVIQSDQDDWDVSGVTDPVPAQLLSQYFLDHLTTDDYIRIECDYYYLGEPLKKNYYVLVWAEDIELFKSLLDTYDGPWVPILFGYDPFSLSDLMKAEADIKEFLEAHPEIIYEEVGILEDMVYVNEVKEGYEELRQFADGYSVPISIAKYVPLEMLNPD